MRLHRIDENAATEVAPLFAYLRELQRSLRCWSATDGELAQWALAGRSERGPRTRRGGA